jgi:hypothetical protein
MVDYFPKIAGAMEVLRVMLPENKPGLLLLPQLLVLVAKAAPKLRVVEVGEDWEGIPVLHSLVFFGQIKELILKNWAFPEDGDVTEMQRLSGLYSLEVGLLF